MNQQTRLKLFTTSPTSSYGLADFNTSKKAPPTNRTIDTDVTMDDYTQAVQTLIKLADMHCGGSSAAAQLLLNLYNGWNYHTNLIDLCSIDDIYLSAAITAILGRVKLSREPHEVISDGDRIFNQLHDDWPELHIRNRYQNG